MLAPVVVAALLASSPSTPSAKPSGVHFVYLVRHGFYERDEKVTDDRKGNGLVAVGHAQAKLTGERIAKLPVKVDHLVSSELLRAVQTADDMGRAMKMTPTRDASLNECTSTTNDPSYMEGDSKQEIAECDAARVTAWERWFKPTPEKDTVDVLVCHGNVIRWMLRKALGADPKDWPYADIGNGSLTVFAVKPDGKIRLVTYSDAGHIPPDQQTWAGRGPGYAKP